MRLRIVKVIMEIVFVLTGIGALIIAIFAYQLHIDKDQAMGPNRTFVLILGLFLIILSLFFFISTFLNRLLKAPISKRFSQVINRIITPFKWLSAPIEKTPDTGRSNQGAGWYALVGAVIAIIISLFYISSGRFTVWPPSTTYFDRLANAFQAGQLSLLEEPPAALLALPDPYYYANRKGVGGYIWDSSLYGGNYYYYWGPVPALLALSVKIIHSEWIIEDQYLIIFSIVGLAILMAALLYRLKTKYFPAIPGWLVMGLTILGVLNTPVFWLVTRPGVHAAPIATGQLFLILGLYTALRGIDAQRFKVQLLILTGFFWGAAIGCRINLGFGIAWMTGLICLFFFLNTRRWHLAVGPALALILPLLLWGGALGWYNYARFGNILETGHRYQLTGGAMPANYKDIVSASYILPNMYNILARPMNILPDEFPFFFTPYPDGHMWSRLIFFPSNPNYIFSEPIAGIFVTTPILWCLLLLVVRPIQAAWNWLKEKPMNFKPIGEMSPSTWFGWMVIGAVISNLFLLLIFIFSTMRYEADLTPLLTILIMLCLGWASTFLQPRQRLWKMVLILVVCLLVISIMVCLLTNFQNSGWIFKNNNPSLYNAIQGFFIGRK